MSEEMNKIRKLNRQLTDIATQIASVGSGGNYAVTNVSTTPYTVTGYGQMVLVNASSGNITINLPTAGGNSGKQIIVKKIDNSANTVTIVPSGAETIDNSSSVTITKQYDSVSLISNGANINIGINQPNVTTTVNDIASKSGGNVYNTEAGLRIWRSRLAKMKAGIKPILNISVLGDSITEGLGSNNNTAADFITQGYVGRIRARLTTLFGDVGNGVIPTHYPSSGVGKTDTAPAWRIRYLTGTWSETNGYGFTNTYKYTTDTTATAAYSFNGTGVTIKVAKDTNGGQFRYNIDGGGWTTYDTYSASVVANQDIPITGLGNGAHTLNIDCSTLTGGKRLSLLGCMEIKGTTGIRVNMCAKSGQRANFVSNTNAMTCSLDTLQPDLTIIALGANDFTSGIALATFSTQVQSIITKAKTYGDVLLVGCGLRSDTAGSIMTQDNYINEMKRLALLSTNNCAFIDIFNRWSGDANYANTTLGFLFDSVHPNSAGHYDMATVILNAILEER